MRKPLGVVNKIALIEALTAVIEKRLRDAGSNEPMDVLEVSSALLISTLLDYAPPSQRGPIFDTMAEGIRHAIDQAKDFPPGRVKPGP